MILTSTACCGVTSYDHEPYLLAVNMLSTQAPSTYILRLSIFFAAIFHLHFIFRACRDLSTQLSSLTTPLTAYHCINVTKAPPHQHPIPCHLCTHLLADNHFLVRLRRLACGRYLPHCADRFGNSSCVVSTSNLPHSLTVCKLTEIYRDMLIIRREVNQRAFRVIEIFVIIGLPASAWPVIVSLLSLVPGPLAEYFQNYNSKFWPWKLIDDLKTPGNDVSMAFAITATFAVLAPSAIYILYIYVARLMDELRPQNSHWHPQSSSRTQKKWYFIGAQRAPAERMAVINHCASYIFQKTVFRKHVYVAAIKSNASSN